MSGRAATPLVITGCGVVTAAGVGLDALAARLAAPVAPARIEPGGDAEGDALGYPDLPVHAIPPYDVAMYLGRKGLRRLDRLTTMGLVAGHVALQSVGIDALGRPWQDRAGVTIGTATGSIRSIAEIATDTITQDEPWMIVPSRFPNAVLNSCAGQLAIRNGLRAVNATVAGGQLSSLSALRYAANAIRGGHAAAMLAGGVEELGPQLAWAWHQSGVLADGAALGEGCALFVVEPADTIGSRQVLAELLGTEVGFCAGRRDRTGLAAGLATAVARLLDRAGIAPADVDVVVPGATAQRGTRRIELQGLRAVLGEEHRVLLRVAETLGETYSASTGLQIAAVLARWSGPDQSDRTPTGEQHALVTSMDHEGNVGALLLHRPL